MIAALTITKFRGINIPFAFLGMAILRIPLWLNRECRFWKLMGSGKDAQVDLAPDLKHWAIFTTWDNKEDCDQFYERSFPMKWFKFFGYEAFTVLLKPLSSHGLWSGKEPFKADKDYKPSSEQIAVITRARINFNKLKEFRSNIKRAADQMKKSDGFILSAGIGENPLLDQATFSIWDSAESMKNYAYKSFDHAEIIKLTRERKWYSEDLFARFEVLEMQGVFNGMAVSEYEPLRATNQK
ncbi:DUF3291 domain-containing protein [Pedobacter petrophilus]|uniref:DUF3291 domain-containing protein n=1 Tax=Pedobacter petrophilus TaxID=1908241 RepID=A0A7K0FWN5_9SPHI|nr:DUF3291 domain-containing protein [Pedobacter petrophilus]MRX76027.1 DUF3291 domain-containing protein [Pedobacter petrophilus]